MDLAEKEVRVKTVGDLLVQRIAEASHEYERLFGLLKTTPEALLDCPLDQALALFRLK